MHATPAPDARTILPPLLACLPTAFVSPRPPPALLPLLSPILRQRVNLFSGNTSSGNGGWLTLLSWDPKRASKLASKVEGLQFEPHPVSGELEVEEIQTIAYRRLDQETLQSRLEVPEFGLLPVYVWCENDEAGGGTGWRLAELRSLEDREDGTEWFESAADANAATSQPRAAPSPAAEASTEQAANDDNNNDDDDDYWAAYDRTPGRTPARTPVKRSPVPTASSSFSAAARGPSAEELAYFARYAAEVQPALDSHDPDEEQHPAVAGASTLSGEELTTPSTANTTTTTTAAAAAAVGASSGHRVSFEPVATSNLGPAGYDSSLPPAYTSAAADAASSSILSAPRPTSPSSSSISSSGRGSVARLEQSAHDMTRAEVGVKQFVSTEIKSLFRLARTVGIGRGEFERMVKTELDVLGMLDADE
ncbi:hypothetical protein MBLNU459_g3043t1 [Dothideomycetes sp. NU459]